MFHLGGKSDSEKRLDALHSIDDMFEFLDKFEKKWAKEQRKDGKYNAESVFDLYGQTTRSWLNYIKSDLS